MRSSAGRGMLGGVTIFLREPLRGLLLSTARGVREGAGRPTTPGIGIGASLSARVRDTGGENPADWERVAECRSRPFVLHYALGQRAVLPVDFASQNAYDQPLS